jgi:hypothetical protein
MIMKNLRITIEDVGIGMEDLRMIRKRYTDQVREYKQRQ